MSFEIDDELSEPQENEQHSQRCTGDPFTCPCETCEAFRYDCDDDRERESEEDQDWA